MEDIYISWVSGPLTDLPSTGFTQLLTTGELLTKTIAGIRKSIQRFMAAYGAPFITRPLNPGNPSLGLLACCKRETWKSFSRDVMTKIRSGEVVSIGMYSPSPGVQ